MDKIHVLKWAVSSNIAIPFSVPGRRVVHFGIQNNLMFVWTECYIGIQDKDHIKLNLVVFPTGFEFPNNEPMNHIQSCFDGSFVWHLYQTN